MGPTEPTDSKDSPIVDRQFLADVDIHNTTTLADPEQYQPIVTWMKKRGIQLDINHQAIDTTGFFDEVAVQLGDRYDTLKLVSNQIKYIHQKGYTNVKLTLSQNDEGQIAAITNFLVGSFTTGPSSPDISTTGRKRPCT